MTSYNTGTTFQVTNSGTPGGHTGTIPGGVLTGDHIYIFVMVFSTATGTLTATLSSSATAPSAVGSQQQTGAAFGIQVTAGLWELDAGASDPGATLTFGATGGTGGAYWYNVGLVAHTGAVAPTDVSGGAKVYLQGQTTGNITTPAETTGVSGDWQVQFVAGGPPNGSDFTVPAGLTSRVHIDHTANQGLLLYIADSNGSVGGSGTAIGNTDWTTSTGSSGNNAMTAFTAGLAPGSVNVTGTFGLAMAAMAESLTGAETISGQARLAMAPMALALTGHETGVNVTGTFGLAMAPMGLRFSSRRPGGRTTAPSSDEARGFKRRLLWGS